MKSQRRTYQQRRTEFVWALHTVAELEMVLAILDNDTQDRYMSSQSVVIEYHDALHNDLFVRLMYATTTMYGLHSLLVVVSCGWPVEMKLCHELDHVLTCSLSHVLGRMRIISVSASQIRRNVFEELALVRKRGVVHHVAGQLLAILVVVYYGGRVVCSMKANVIGILCSEIE